MNKKILTLAIAGSLAVSLSAFANKGAEYKAPSESKANKGWYVGGGINGNSVGTNSHEIFNFIELELEEADIGFDVFVGREINKHWSAELGFTQVGQSTFDAEFMQDAVAEFEVKQWNVHLVGMYKLNVVDHFNLFAKLGGAYLNSTQEFEIDTDDGMDNNFVDVTEGNLSNFVITYGVGAEVTWDKWGIRGEYNILQPAHDISNEFYIADIVSANIYYKFM